MSVRPESIVLATPGAEEAMGGHVEQVAFLGTSTQYQVRTDGGLLITALIPRAGMRVAVGTDVALSWEPGEALVLGSAPAARLEEPS